MELSTHNMKLSTHNMKLSTLLKILTTLLFLSINTSALEHTPLLSLQNSIHIAEAAGYQYEYRFNEDSEMYLEQNFTLCNNDGSNSNKNDHKNDNNNDNAINTLPTYSSNSPHEESIQKPPIYKQIQFNTPNIPNKKPKHLATADLSEIDEDDWGHFFAFWTLVSLISLFALAILWISLVACCCQRIPPNHSTTQDLKKESTIHPGTIELHGSGIAMQSHGNGDNGGDDGGFMRTQSNFTRSPTSLNTALLQQEQYQNDLNESQSKAAGEKKNKGTIKGTKRNGKSMVETKATEKSKLI